MPGKFVADVMLGRLARLMRFSGYDVEYDNSFDDGELLKKSKSRILLTKDRELANKTSGNQSYFVNALGAVHQLKEIQEQFPLPGKTNARCLLCNRKLRRIAKSKIRHLVPPFVFSSHDEFYSCGECKKVYWRGTHFEHMLRMIK